MDPHYADHAASEEFGVVAGTVRGPNELGSRAISPARDSAQRSLYLPTLLHDQATPRPS